MPDIADIESPVTTSVSSTIHMSTTNLPSTHPRPGPKKGSSIPASKDFEASFGKLSSSFGFGGTTAAYKLPKRNKNKNVNRSKTAQKDAGKYTAMNLVKIA
ncbi:hypothetical protein QCA50_016198 [Cerrena zonata]|uniref:Uncharacterized protein n=1 Tax=Cerrena zonata TaxID=2478898 RepID=A0AAW0FGP3_9APHY